MKALCSGDLHIGYRHVETFPHINRLEVTIQIVYDMIRLCKIKDVRIIILNGDVLDKAYPSLDVLLELMYALLAAKGEGISVYWVRGNHEVALRTKLAQNVMHLFESLCHVVCEPQSITSDKAIIMLCPWYPDAEVMKSVFREMNRAWTIGETRRRILFTHLPLREAHVSPSNQTIGGPIGVDDLFPENWTAVMLSDLHMAQFVGDKGQVCYMGAPIPHTFGDTDTVGLWFIDTEANVFEPIDITHDANHWFDGLPPYRLPRYPRFQRWFSDNEEEMPKFPIDPNDYNEVRIHPKWMGYFKKMYPTCRVLPLEGAVEIAPIDPAGERLSIDDIATAEGLVGAWMKRKKVENPILKKLGMELLQT